jgi:hypothetical protein
MEIFDRTKCFVCDSGVKRKGSSLHAWDIEYDCGCRIFGAIDTDTRGNEIEVGKECPKLAEIKNKLTKINE